MADAPLRTTVLHDDHVSLGARMVPFAGYDMPVQYAGVLAEARAVRTAAGIFDVSHMGRFAVEGPDGRALLDWVHTADVGEAMPAGRARYGLLCNEAGGILDDAIVYRLGDERFMIVANAANAGKVFGWLERWRSERFPSAALTDRTAEIAMIALQGPDAMSIAGQVAGFDPDAVRPFNVVETEVMGAPALIARTGYTGEDGVEVMPASEVASALWLALMDAGAAPCGLGARDALRLEAALLLHGSDMDETVNPIEAGLERFVRLERDFCGADAVRAAAENGTTRVLAGFRTAERGPAPRAHHRILIDGSDVGEVTSGSYSPYLDTNIGLGYLPREASEPGTPIAVDVRGRQIPAQIVALPFYKRSR